MKYHKIFHKIIITSSPCYILGTKSALGQNFFSYENLKDDFNCNINGVLQGEWYSR